MVWHKSSHSGADGCVEVSLAWHKSSYSAESANCVEVAEAVDVYVRDSKDPTGPVLQFNREAWADFVHGVMIGEFSAPK